MTSSEHIYLTPDMGTRLSLFFLLILFLNGNIHVSLDHYFYPAYNTLKMNGTGDKSDVLIIIPKRSHSVR